MKTTLALIIKFVVTLIAAWISFSLFGNVLLTVILVIAGAGTILNYLIGDLLILPRFGNIIASVMDGVLTAITAYIVLILNNAYAMTSIFIFSIIVVAFEFFFHMYLFKASMIQEKDSTSNMLNNKKLNYRTEFAKEIKPFGDIWKPSNRSDDNEWYSAL